MLARALHSDGQPSLPPPLQLRGPFCGGNETIKASSESLRDESPNTRTNYLIALYHRDALEVGLRLGENEVDKLHFLPAAVKHNATF